MNDITYQMDAGNNIHIVIGEYTLCGVAWDEISAEETHERVVDCPDCVSIIQNLRRVRVRRPTQRVPDVAKSGENKGSISGKRSARSPRR